MKLQQVTIQKFRNFVEPQVIDIEDDVTVLVGKNESGKTTILKALHRLNPANGDSRSFDLTRAPHELGWMMLNASDPSSGDPLRGRAPM